MARWRQVVELAMTEGEVAALTAVSRARSEPAPGIAGSDVALLSARTRRSVRSERSLACIIIRRSSAASNGRWPMARWRRLRTRPRPGKEPTISLADLAGMGDVNRHPSTTLSPTAPKPPDMVRTMETLIYAAEK
jgi:hypothetical protein